MQCRTQLKVSYVNHSVRTEDTEPASMLSVPISQNHAHKKGLREDRKGQLTNKEKKHSAKPFRKPSFLPFLSFIPITPQKMRNSVKTVSENSCPKTPQPCRPIKLIKLPVLLVRFTELIIHTSDMSTNESIWFCL